MSRKQFAKFIIVLAILLSASLIIDKSVFHGYVRCFVGDDVFKSLLPFSFATMLGGAIFLYIGIMKDDEIDREQRASTRVALVKEVDMLYRSAKQIKRTLRARCTINGTDLFIEKKFFENSLDELNKIQIALEQNMETIRIRADLFDDKTREMLLSSLRYAARYLHDVFEDFERHIVYDNDIYCTVSAECKNLRDFLSSGVPPKDIEEHLTNMANETIDLDKRFEAFYRIKIETDGRRFRAVADKCFSLATSILKK